MIAALSRFQRHPVFLGNIAVGILTTSTAVAFPSEASIRWLALSLQAVAGFAGILDLWLGATKAGHPGILASVKKSIAGLIPRRNATVVLTGVGCASAVGTVTARVCSRLPTGTHLTPEERLTALEYNISKIDEEIGAILRRINEETSTLKSKLLQEQTERAKALDQIRVQAQEEKVTRFDFLCSCAVWTLAGTIISGYPEVFAQGGAWIHALVFASE